MCPIACAAVTGSLILGEAERNGSHTRRRLVADGDPLRP
jgi:hypothetical protein